MTYLANRLVGGLLFMLMMLHIGLLPIVANLIGAASALTGFLVHLVIAQPDWRQRWPALPSPEL
jgi:hypothetical protein